MNFVLHLRTRALVLLMLPLLLMGSAIVAKDSPVLTVSALSGTQKMAIRLTGIFTNSQLQVIDAQGEVLYEEAIAEGSSYQKILNLQGLPNGQYSLIIDAGNEEVVQPFIITRAGLRCDPSACKTFQAPEVKLLGRTVDVHWLLSGQDEVSFQLHLPSGEVVCEMSIAAGDQRLSRRFDLSALPAGDYVLHLSQQDKTWTNTIFLQ